MGLPASGHPRLASFDTVFIGLAVGYPVQHYVLILLSVFLVACSEQGRETARLATGCINASPDNRVKLSGSWSNNFAVQIVGDEFTVRTEVPAGIGLDGKLKIKKREFRCRQKGDEIEYIGALWIKN